MFGRVATDYDSFAYTGFRRQTDHSIIARTLIYLTFWLEIFIERCGRPCLNPVRVASIPDVADATKNHE